MHTTTLSAALGAAALGALAVPATAADAGELIDLGLQEMASGAGSWSEAFAQGEASLEFNYRFETVDDDGNADKAHASTLATLFGYRTAPYHGVTTFLEFEAVSLVGDEAYNDGTDSATSTRPGVADPAGAELNQFWAEHALGGGTLRLGRQRIQLDNLRFIGNVGWRQNEQTYDALSWRGGDDLPMDVFYAYVNNVNRIFGVDESTAKNGDTHTDTHLLNLARDVDGLGKVGVYGYLLDNHGAYAAVSSMTFGARLDGGLELGDEVDLDYLLELARQSDAGDNPTGYDADYYHLRLALDLDAVQVTLGQELLGSDGGAASFQTPLATLHAFNGWADKFLATPAAGLEDTYLGVTGSVAGLNLGAWWHDFASDEGGMDYGTELDLVAKKKLSDSMVAGVKYADYSEDGFSTDTTKMWFWLTWTP